MTIQIEIISQRIDIWLWHARIYKTRSISNQFIKQGHVRVNTNPIKKSATLIKKNDILTLFWYNQIRVIKIKNFTTQRVSAKLCNFLYEEILEK